MKIMIANNVMALAEALSEYPNTATVEAEFGDEVVTGSLATLAHHGRYSDRPAPCIAPIIPHIDVFSADVAEFGKPLRAPLDAIGLSHVDLDTLGGILGLLGRRQDSVLEGDGVFWRTAANVDLHGPHHLERALTGARNEYIVEACAAGHGHNGFMPRVERLAGDAVASVRRQIHAWWAWTGENRIYPPRDGTVADVTGQVRQACVVIGRILSAYDETLLEAGDKWVAGQEALNFESYVDTLSANPGDPGVVARASSRFCGHLYTTPNGDTAEAMVFYNMETGAITVSLADPIPGVSCERIVKGLWGPEAGGRDVIAGSPRGEVFGLEDLMATAVHVSGYIAQYRPK